MLYDPKWEQKTKADPLNLETLIAWLKEQDPREEYNPFIPSICLVGQFCAAHGVSDVPVMLEGWIAKVAFGEASWSEMTFGAALERARALQNR